MTIQSYKVKRDDVCKTSSLGHGKSSIHVIFPLSGLHVFHIYVFHTGASPGMDVHCVLD